MDSVERTLTGSFLDIGGTKHRNTIVPTQEVVNVRHLGISLPLADSRTLLELIGSLITSDVSSRGNTLDSLVSESGLNVNQIGVEEVNLATIIVESLNKSASSDVEVEVIHDGTYITFFESADELIVDHLGVDLTELGEEEGSHIGTRCFLHSTKSGDVVFSYEHIRHSCETDLLHLSNESLIELVSIGSTSGVARRTNNIFLTNNQEGLLGSIAGQSGREFESNTTIQVVDRTISDLASDSHEVTLTVINKFKLLGSGFNFNANRTRDQLAADKSAIRSLSGDRNFKLEATHSLDVLILIRTKVRDDRAHVGNTENVEPVEQTVRLIEVFLD